MIKKHKKIIYWLGCLAGSLAAVSAATAAGSLPLEKLNKVATDYGPYTAANDTTLLTIFGTAVSIVLGLLGAVFLGLMLFAGYNWMTAQGEEEKVVKAKNIIIQAIIGIIIVVGAYAAWAFIFKRLF